MHERSPRKRIPSKGHRLPPVPDGQEFVPNKSSVLAKPVSQSVEQVHIQVWFDKHYHYRLHVGDDIGKRHGIDPTRVEELVKRSIKHLLAYSSIDKGFRFLNHEQFAEQRHRVVLREESEGSMLYVVIQSHLLSLTEFEVTVITAMQGDLKLGQGQHVVELQGDSSILYKFNHGRFTEIAQL